MDRGWIPAMPASDNWEGFVATQRGIAPDISPQVRELKHPARDFLNHLRKHGVPVLFTTEPWNQERKDAAVQRGPHQSAKMEVEFVR